MDRNIILLFYEWDHNPIQIPHRFFYSVLKKENMFLYPINTGLQLRERRIHLVDLNGCRLLSIDINQQIDTH